MVDEGFVGELYIRDASGWCLLNEVVNCKKFYYTYLLYPNATKTFCNIPHLLFSKHR